MPLFPQGLDTREGTIRWYFYVAYLYGGAFLVRSRGI
jgi:hypothetical protein